MKGWNDFGDGKGDDPELIKKGMDDDQREERMKIEEEGNGIKGRRECEGKREGRSLNEEFYGGERGGKRKRESDQEGDLGS